MQKSFTTLFLLLFSTILLNGALTRAPEDFLGRISIPSGAEAEVLKFKTDLIVYAGTNGSGLYVSYDAGTNWGQLTGFPTQFPCIKDILIAPNKDLFAATFGGGVYYSNDNGTTWTARNLGLKNLYVQSLTMTAQGRLVCGTYGGGIYYSDNNGGLWVRTDIGLRYDNITCLETMSNGFIIAGTWGGGFYISRDTCKTWRVSNTQLSNLFINDLVKDQSGKVYAATNGAGVMMTGDGITWNTYGNNFHYKDDPSIKPLLDTAVSAVGANSYQMLMGTRTAGMYFWDDLWNCWQNTGDWTVGITACAVSPKGTILATRSLGDVIRSTDNGVKWDICAKKIVNLDLEEYSTADDFLNVYVSKYDNSLISISKSNNVRTVYKSVNHGNDWKYYGTFNSKKINDAEISPKGDIFIAADEGIFATLDSGKTYNIVCAPTDKKERFWEFNEIEYDSLAKTWAASWSYMVPDTNVPPGEKPYLELIIRLYKSANNGQTWSFTGYGETGISNLYIDKQCDWYMNQGGNFIKSSDHGGSYQTLYASKPGKMYYGKDGNIYYVDYTNKIYYSKNYSSTFTLIPFAPEILVESNKWSVQQMGADKYGNLYIAIQISTPLQGVLYELYMTKDLGLNCQTMKGCYNMDRIRSIQEDNNGYSFFLTNALYKVLNPKNLKAPVATAPKNLKMGEEINPIFAWERAPLAEEYELQIDPTDLFDSPFETNITGDTTCKAIIDLAFNTNYYWRVRSKTHSARSAWTQGTFTVGMEAPILISPEIGKVGVPLNAPLKWHAIADATHYLIQVSLDESFEHIVYEKDNHPDTTITTDKLVGLKYYFWRVKAFTQANASRWSQIWNFRTVLGPPQLIYPANNSIDKLLSEQFNWRKSIEAETYYIQIAKDAAFTNMFFEGDAGADTFKLINNMLPETEYFWHVASVNTVGTSEYSDTWKFTTSLKAVTLQYPDNNKVNVPKNVKLTWLEHNAGSLYQIQISKTVDFKSTVEDQKVSNVLEFQSTKLEYYQTYYWRVRLVIDQRVGIWSDTWKFKTGIETTGLLNPPDKSVAQPTTIKFKWGEILGAKFYQLQISKNEQFTDLVYSMDSLTKAEQYVDDLEPEVLYYWRVRVWNEESFGTSQWSPIWTFTTGQVTLVLRSPKTGSTNVNIPALLMWFTATTADYYHLQVASDENFTNVIFKKDSIYETKIVLTKTDLQTNTDYYWHVKGVSKQYTTPWSETWHFTTGTISVEDSDKFSSITLYPNPTGSKAELSINFSESCDAKLIISTADGKLVLSDAIKLIFGETRYEIATQQLANGSYYITIITPSGIITRELVVVR